MDSLTVTREQFRLGKKDELEFLAQALGNISGSYTTETISPTAVTLQGTPTLAAGAEPAANDNSLRLANTAWVKKYANSASGTEPSNPINGQIWIDTSKEPPLLLIWDEVNGEWVEVSGSGGGANAYTLLNDDANLVGGDATTAINAALIAAGSIASTDELNVSDQLEVTDSGNPDANAQVKVGRYFYDGTEWYTTKEIAGFLELTGGNMTGAVTQTEREITVAAGGFDLSTSNFWRCAIADVPNPTSGVNGQSGLIRLETVVTSWGGNFKNTPVSTEVGDIIPFYVESASSIALGTKNITGTANTGNIYAGASAWAKTQADGTLDGGLNVTVSRTGEGTYQYTFANPMPNANYAVVVSAWATAFTTNQYSVMVGARSSTGFTIHTKQASTNAVTDVAHELAVHSSNALPPRGGTGADAWAAVDRTTVDGACNVPSSFNIASVTRNGLGFYDVVFSTAMPSANYAVTCSCDDNASTSVSSRLKTETGFRIATYDISTSQFFDTAFSFVVHATNAQLPDTVTQEQIDGVLNNWTRTGTTLSPTNAGDSIDVDGSAKFASDHVFLDTPEASGCWTKADSDANRYHWRFFTASGTAGGILTNTLTTTYETSSDYRLKENVVPVANAISRLQKLKPCSFNFIANPDKTVDGFLAHEAQEVVPECSSGKKDAVDDEGKPVYQGIDQSKLVPLLTAALQEAITRIEQLEARVAELEGGY